jgi:hypothetical protein
VANDEFLLPTLTALVQGTRYLHSTRNAWHFHSVCSSWTLLRPQITVLYSPSSQHPLHCVGHAKPSICQGQSLFLSRILLFVVERFQCFEGNYCFCLQHEFINISSSYLLSSVLWKVVLYKYFWGWNGGKHRIVLKRANFVALIKESRLKCDKTLIIWGEI